MADYDSGEITDRERKASENQTAISKQNVRDVQNQLVRQVRTGSRHSETCKLRRLACSVPWELP